MGEIVRFRDERFFDGAVQLGWLERRADRAREAARAFVFHGPRYHGAEGDERGRLKDTASFVRDLLDSLVQGRAGREVNPYTLAVSSYGTGKSHLAVTCATLLDDPRGETARAILDQLVAADAELGAEAAALLGQLGKPALVVALDGMNGFHLGQALSRGIFAGLARHGIDASAIRELSPRFQTAAQFVTRNAATRVERFNALLPGLELEQILARLGEQDEEVYAAVDALYLEANGHAIPVEGQESAQELIETLCRLYCGPEGPFSQLVILFDELGRYLEYAAEKPRLAGDAVLQQLFQGVQDNAGRVRFVGFIQYELKAYLKRFSSADLMHLQRYVGRFDTAEKCFLSTNLETLFAHMIAKDEAALDRLWESSGAEQHIHASWARLAPVLPGFERFPVWRDPERFARVIGRGCWPLHPLAVWFLTRLNDLVQSRSALTFIRDLIEQGAKSPACRQDGAPRQVSVAELVLDRMLDELLAAERARGSTTSETLQQLLEKLRGHLERSQQLVLAGVAVLEKLGLGKQRREGVDLLLSEATTLEAVQLASALEQLAELGALEWNAELGRYELLSDGATRGQFQHWLRERQAELGAQRARDLFMRRAALDCGLAEVVPDFAQSRAITTADWFFQGRLAHAPGIEHAIREAFGDWRQATLPKDAKGQLIYLYLHPEDETSEIAARIQEVFASELGALKLDHAPIWVMALEDRQGQIAEHLGRLQLFEEQMNEADRERFRRFIPGEIERSRQALKDGAREALRERLGWVAGFADLPPGRLRSVAGEIFARVYPRALPFPFDGFGSAAGGGAIDAAQLARALMTRQVKGPWVQAQPVRLQNRVSAVLASAWQVLQSNGKIGAPRKAELAEVHRWLEDCHRQTPERSLLDSYRALLAPPYGMNAASAMLLLAVLVALESPPRRLEVRGELVETGDWVGRLYPRQRQHHPEEALLADTRLRFLSEGAQDRWRQLLDRWEVETRLEGLVAFAAEAERMSRGDPIPEVLEGRLAYLRDQSKAAAERLRHFKHQLDSAESTIERAERKEAVGEMLKAATQLIELHEEVEDATLWSASAPAACQALLRPLQQMIVTRIHDWIPRQGCHQATDVSAFRHRMEKAVASLRGLGLETEARALEEQARRSIAQVEKRQHFGLTLAQSDDYPRQPEPSDSTPVRELLDGIEQGERLIEAVEQARDVLSAQEIQARIGAIRQREQRLRAQLERQRAQLGALYEARLESEEALHDALARAAHLHQLFVGTRDEREVSELRSQLERILSDLAAWETGDWDPERLAELLDHQVTRQLGALRASLDERDIDPAWDLNALYGGLMQKRLAAAQARSADWIERRWLDPRQIVALGLDECQRTERELAEPPAYLAAADRARTEQLRAALAMHRKQLEERVRHERLQAWMQPLLELGPIEGLDQAATEQWLKTARQPPVMLGAKEQAALAPIIAALTAHLDQMTVDEIKARIERLPPPRQAELRTWLMSALAEG
ncbi:MAG: hypothetical protein JXM75_08975, partial [Chromatiaceae bacterium]|nr:hypothetical protein [Chromatiaceae bacterium]